MKLYRTTRGAVVEEGGVFYALADTWDDLINHKNLPQFIRATIVNAQGSVTLGEGVLAPIDSPEVPCGVVGIL